LQVSTRDAFVVVDACQGRFKEEWLHEYLGKDAIVLITGMTAPYDLHADTRPRDTVLRP
jgi:hypothetical protein